MAHISFDLKDLKKKIKNFPPEIKKVEWDGPLKIYGEGGICT